MSDSKVASEESERADLWSWQRSDADREFCVCGCIVTHHELYGSDGVLGAEEGDGRSAVDDNSHRSLEPALRYGVSGSWFSQASSD